MAYLSVSAFAADIFNIGKDIEKVKRSGADLLHIDVMDGHFVPLMGFGITWIDAIYKDMNIPLDIHLMTENTALFVPQYLEFDVKTLLFHVEAETEEETNILLALIRDRGVRCGLAISPNTPVSALHPYLGLVDEILVMSTMPGCKDSTFQSDTFQRLQEISTLIQSKSLDIVISVDGGIDLEHALRCIENGADKIVMGRAFFNSAHPELIAETIHKERLH